MYDRTTWGLKSEGTKGYVAPNKRTTTKEEDEWETLKRKEERASSTKVEGSAAAP